ncbi:MAG: hypothetical protein ACK8QZ_03480 [Anaerolineales bacterium]
MRKNEATRTFALVVSVSDGGLRLATWVAALAISSLVALQATPIGKLLFLFLEAASFFPRKVRGESSPLNGKVRRVVLLFLFAAEMPDFAAKTAEIGPFLFLGKPNVFGYLP